MFPKLLGDRLAALGFVLAVLATCGRAPGCCNRSTVVFQLRAVGATPPRGADRGHLRDPRLRLVVMLSGLAVSAGTAQVSRHRALAHGGIAASFGFDAITVALLGGQTAGGTFFAGLYGAFRAVG
ncbi:hypothetical protein QJS66_08595 [Kocuria rhizophila]|nr:hypothetical protein QJS66_08595 [Kocuria rhizophila]